MNIHKNEEIKICELQKYNNKQVLLAIYTTYMMQHIKRKDFAGEVNFELNVLHHIHSKITMAGEVVPYYAVTALVPTLK